MSDSLHSKKSLFTEENSQNKKTNLERSESRTFSRGGTKRFSCTSADGQWQTFSMVGQCSDHSKTPIRY